MRSSRALQGRARAQSIAQAAAREWGFGLADLRQPPCCRMAVRARDAVEKALREQTELDWTEIAQIIGVGWTGYGLPVRHCKADDRTMSLFGEAHRVVTHG